MKSFKSNGRKFVPPCVKNWIHTLKGFRYLWTILQEEGLNLLCSRKINQDPVENFFCRIRNHGAWVVNPTCQSFINSVKTLMINDFVGVHSLGANCQDDDAVLMDNLKNFIGSREGSSKLNFEANIDVSFSNKIMSEFSHVTSILRKNIEVYIALYADSYTHLTLQTISRE